MTDSAPPAAYYPDPAGSPNLRWWDGRQWSDHVVAPPERSQSLEQSAPPASPAPAPATEAPAPAGPIVASQVVAAPVSILATGPVGGRRRPRIGTGRLLVVAGCVVALTAVAVGWHASSPPSSAARNGPVVTPAQAEAVLRSYWSVHETAVVDRDIAKLRSLDTGAAAAYEPGAVACCIGLDRPRTLVKTEYFVPRQTSYPAHFLVEALSDSHGWGWTEVLLFTKASADAPWLVLEDSGFGGTRTEKMRLGMPTTDQDGYVLTPTAISHARARTAAYQLAALWQRVKNTGRMPPHSPFEISTQFGFRLGEIAAHRQGTVQANGVVGHFRFYVNPNDPMYEFADNGFDLACQPIRETVDYRSTAGHPIVQDSQRRNWGGLLSPGHYRTLTSRNAWQTCFLVSSNPRVPIRVLNQDFGGSVPTAH